MAASVNGYVRSLGLSVGVALILATLLALALSLDLVGTPPSFPDSATIVDRLLGSASFVRTVWPFDLASNLSFALAMVAAIPFAWLIGLRIVRPDERAVAIGLLVTGALVGIVATVAYIGARQTTIDIAYCDCGFKEQESISQMWALNLASGARDWLLYGAAILTAIGAGIAGAALSRPGTDGETPAMPASWGMVAYLAAAVLIVGTLLQIAGIGDPAGALISALGTGLLLPIWAFWLARDFRLPTASDR